MNVGRTKECPIQPGPDLPVPSAMLGWSWPQSWSPTSPFSSGRAPTEEAPQGQPKDNTCFLCQPFVEILCVFWGRRLWREFVGEVSCMIFLRGKDGDMLYD